MQQKADARFDRLDAVIAEQLAIVKGIYTSLYDDKYLPPNKEAAQARHEQLKEAYGAFQNALSKIRATAADLRVPELVLKDKRREIGELNFRMSNEKGVVRRVLMQYSSPSVSDAAFLLWHIAKAVEGGYKMKDEDLERCQAIDLKLKSGA